MKRYVYAFLAVLFLSTCFSSQILAQDRTVTGTVTDETGQAIPGASVLIKGTTTGTVTDANGRYSISLEDDQNVLVVSFVGYATTEVTVNDRTTLDITLAEDVSQLQEVVVVGYGVQIEQKVTGSIQQVDGRELEDMPVAQITQKLQGRLAGVQINQINGNPGEGMQVRIRGQVSLSAGSQPLYVVDGQPITGDINSINPNEIESISVLKDAASTSLYGSRAANGVVLITTKRGGDLGTTFDVSVSSGVQSLPEYLQPELLNGQEWVQMRQEAFTGQGLPVPPQFQNPEQFGEGTDWFREVTRNAPINDVSITMSSNQEKFGTTAVLGYFNQEGVVLNTGFERFSLRLNSDYEFNEVVKAGFNVAPTYTLSNLVPTDFNFYNGNIIYNAMLTPPIFSPDQDLDGDGVRDPMLDAGLGGSPSYTGWVWPNFKNNVEQRDQETQRFRLLSNAFVELEPVEGLKLRSSINVDLGSAYDRNFLPSTIAPNPWQGVPRASSLSITRSNFTSWLNENTITYGKTFGDHDFEVLGGYTVQKFRSENMSASASNHADDRIRTLQSATNFNPPSNGIGEWALISYLARVQYAFQNKYLLTAAIRSDGSSRFGENNRWGNFPSVSAGWVLSEEDFIGDLGPISFAKIRGSWGITGNNNIGNYTQFGAVDIGQGAVFGNTILPGAAATSIANRDLGWELSKQVDVGLDLGLFNDRISFSYDYYNKLTTDLLWSLAVPPASGFNNFTGNIGEIKFWGHEFLVNSRNRVGELDINIGGNIAFNRNEVVSLDETVPFIINNGTLTMAGMPIAQFYGMVHDGVYVNQADFDSSPVANISQVGGPKYVDVNGDGILTRDGQNGGTPAMNGEPGSDDKSVIGNPIPDFIYGVTVNMRYKGFDLSIVGSGSQGNDIFWRSLQGLVNHGDGLMNVWADLKDRWKSPSDPGSGRWGKNWGSTAPQDRDWFSSNFVFDGSHFTIKNITLGYTLPPGLINGIRNLRIYSSVQQAFVFSSYPGANPEVSGSLSPFQAGYDYSTYPIPRTFTFGLNVGF